MRSRQHNASELILESRGCNPLKLKAIIGVFLVYSTEFILIINAIAYITERLAWGGLLPILAEIYVGLNTTLKLVCFSYLGILISVHLSNHNLSTVPTVLKSVKKVLKEC